MDGDSSPLITLEKYIADLFSGTISNEELQRIQHTLEKFQKQKGAWKESLFYLQNTNNQNVAMYALTVLEGFILKGWFSLSNEERLELRSSLYNWLLEKHNTIPFFIRNKIIQLVVHIARFEWPYGYPEFYSNILQLISSSDAQTTAFGLAFLQTTSEELGTPRDDLLSSRKSELKQRLLHLVPNTLSVLTGLLEAVWEKHKSTVTSTPPPSPTLGISQSCPRMESSIPPLNSELDNIARLTLQCLTHFFSWIPLSSHVTPHLLELIFRFVGMGTQQSLPLPAVSNVLPVSVLALGTVNEILYKSCFPAEFEDFVVLLFNNACIILHHLVNNMKNHHILHAVHPQFVDKFLELIHLLVSSHLRRLEGRPLPMFSVPQFLSLFFTFTFDQSDWNRYLSCIDTWHVFLDYIKQMIEKDTDKEALMSRYHDSLLALSNSVLKKVMFVANSKELEILEDETSSAAADSDVETEWHKVLRQSVEIFVMTSEILKNQTLPLLNEPFQRCASAYLALSSISSGNIIQLESKSQVKEIEAYLKDLSSLLQLIGRLCELHTGPEFSNNFETAHSLVQRLLDLASYGSSIIHLSVAGSACHRVKSNIVDVHINCLSALRAWCHWILQWSNETSNGNQSSSCRPDALVHALIDAASSIFNPSLISVIDDCKKNQLYSSAVQLLSAVVTVIRSPHIWNSVTWNQLFDSVYDIRHLPPMIHRELVQCVIASALTPFRCCTTEQRWHERQIRLQNFVNNATKSTRIVLQQLNSDPSSATLMQGRTTVLSTLILLSDVASCVRDEGTASKAAAHAVIESWIDPALVLFSSYVQDHEVIEGLFTFFWNVFNSLLNPLGVTCAEKAIQTFLHTVTQHNLHHSLQKEDKHGIHAMEQFLKILQIVVQEPYAAFKRFLPSTLTLCLEHIYPCVIQISCSDVKEAFYNLLTIILRNNWRHFFKGSVLTTYGSRDSNVQEPVENQAQFLLIMNAYGQAFLQTDIQLFQQNLQALDSLQTKWKLYHKSLFRETVANQFMSTLLEVLSNGSHELLKEEMALSIYAMASPDFEQFFNQFLPNFLLHCAGIDDQQRILLKNNFRNDTDLPSFTQHVHQLTSDLRCFRSTNAAAGSLFQC